MAVYFYLGQIQAVKIDNKVLSIEIDLRNVINLIKIKSNISLAIALRDHKW